MVAWMVSICGCGLAYQAGSRIKTSHMKDDLKVGETSLQVHQDWGEPDLRKDMGDHSELWSYASRPNNNDIAAKQGAGFSYGFGPGGAVSPVQHY